MKRPGMTHWYTPMLALRTGVRVVLSAIFGSFADRRETLSVTNPIPGDAFDPELDFSTAATDEGIWLDYMSDTGDGFDATYAMAKLLSADSLEVAGVEHDLPRARVLILGGDQVYPDPSRQEYQDRLLDPFEKAAEEAGMPNERSERPSLFAIPGNHDWYDGLVAFGNLFCRRRIAIPGQATLSRHGRSIARWNTHQTRSYFALRLTDDWWVWAFDSQLSGYIDKPQVEYFAYVGRHWMQANSNVIVAVASPAWVGEKNQLDRDDFNSFDYISRLAERMQDGNGNDLNHKVRLILTGDHHHYVRYEEDGSAKSEEGTPRNLIVAGGGGAFLHPTHHLGREERHTLVSAAQRASGLKERVFRIAGEGKTEAVYPSREDSRNLAWRNLRFAALNWEMTGSLFGIYLFFVWTLSVWSVALNGQTLLRYIGPASWKEALYLYFDLVFKSPLHVALILIGWVAFLLFCGKVPRKIKLVAGTLHWLVQTFAALFAGWLVMNVFAARVTQHDNTALIPESIVIILGAFAAACVSATVFGAYLLIQLNLFNRHYNEAFSSIRVDRFRSFLRMNIDNAGTLTLYPVGLENVPEACSRNYKLLPRMIEPPIIFER